MVTVTVVVLVMVTVTVVVMVYRRLLEFQSPTYKRVTATPAVYPRLHDKYHGAWYFSNVSPIELTFSYVRLR